MAIKPEASCHIVQLIFLLSIYLKATSSAILGNQKEDFPIPATWLESINGWLPLGSSWTQCTIWIVQSHNALETNVPRENIMALRTSLENGNPMNNSVQHHQHFTESCTIAFYFIPINHLGLLHEKFATELPGGIFKSFHFLFLQSQAEVEDYKEFQRILMRQPILPPQQYKGWDGTKNFGFEFVNFKQMHHLIVIESRILNGSNAYIIDMHTYNTWFNQTVPMLGTGNKANSLFPDKWHNLHDGQLILGTTPDSNQAQLEAYIRTKEVKSGGYSAAGLSEILIYLNTTPYFSTRTAIFGHKNAQGKWIGNIGEVLDGAVDIGVGIGLTYERSSVIIYSHQYHFDKVEFLTALPMRLTSSSGSLDFLSRPFQAFVWLNLGIILIATYIIVLWKKHFDRHLHKKTKYMPLIILNILLRPAFDQPNETPSLRAKMRDTLTRVVLAQWLLGLIVLSSGYKSSFISVLLAPTIIHPPKTFSQLMESNYKIGATLYNESYMAGNFRAMNNSFAWDMQRRVKGYALRDPEAYLKVEKFEDRQILMGISTFLELPGNYFLTDRHGQSLYKISKDYLLPICAGIVLPKKFPHLLETLNTIIDRFYEAGTFAHYLQLEKRFKSQEGRKLSYKIRAARSEVRDDQGLHHFLTILMFGHGIAAAMMFMELSHFYCKKFYNKMYTMKVVEY